MGLKKRGGKILEERKIRKVEKKVMEKLIFVAQVPGKFMN